MSDTLSTQPNVLTLDQVMEPILSAGDDASAAVPEADEGGVKQQILKQQIIEALCSVYDPEIPVDIYELGLIYDLKVEPDGKVDIKMTLTSPACPVAGTLPIEVENKVAAIPGVTDVNLELVWDPPYGIEMMSEAARLQLGLL